MMSAFFRQSFEMVSSSSTFPIFHKKVHCLRIKLNEELFLLVIVFSLEEVSMGWQDGLNEEISSLCSERDL